MQARREVIFLITCNFSCSAQTWIRAGHWYAGSKSHIPEINSALFTHLTCAFVNVNSSTYRLSIPSAHEQYFSSFTDIVKSKNPSIKTLLFKWNKEAAASQLILGQRAHFSALSKMLESLSNRKSFIESSIELARCYFQGIDLLWPWLNTALDMINMEKLLDEWRAAVTSEARNTGLSGLKLTMAIGYFPILIRNLDWAHVKAYDYHLPSKRMLPVLMLLYTTLRAILTPTMKTCFGFAFPRLCFWHCYDKRWIHELQVHQGVHSKLSPMMHNATCVLYDRIELVIRAKIAYAKEKKLLGTNVFHQVSNDNQNWALSWARRHYLSHTKLRRKEIVTNINPLSSIVIVILITFMVCYSQRELLKTKGYILNCDGYFLIAIK
ncbi:hypothetical protein DVH24_017638 [Malus domestica]|uniref:GH18 domain-containing protein n=1 Tax=Malus domestica TaxID=3750 RepID=A0A498KDZ5_MALDO|nr:hypothetical protein DVH24_017638 [Malus domestica]